MNQEKSFVSFYLGEYLFGLNIELVREINRKLHTTPVPLAPDTMRGLANLRGQIVSVLDMNRCLGIPSDEGSGTHNIILKTDAELSALRLRGDGEGLFTIPDKVGLLVDAISEVVTVNSKQIMPPPANIGELDGKYLAGVVQLDHTLMAVVNIRKVLENTSP